jgi:hypothetical protein
MGADMNGFVAQYGLRSGAMGSLRELCHAFPDFAEGHLDQLIKSSSDPKLKLQLNTMLAELAASPIVSDDSPDNRRRPSYAFPRTQATLHGVKSEDGKLQSTLSVDDQIEDSESFSFGRQG